MVEPAAICVGSDTSVMLAAASRDNVTTMRQTSPTHGTGRLQLKSAPAPELAHTRSPGGGLEVAVDETHQSEGAAHLNSLLAFASDRTPCQSAAISVPYCAGVQG